MAKIAPIVVGLSFSWKKTGPGSIKGGALEAQQQPEGHQFEGWQLKEKRTSKQSSSCICLFIHTIPSSES
ncbi:hypothetical protein SDJN02_24631, partial [Cucurbita argyrosperma subsp. argyrosperma]